MAAFHVVFPLYPGVTHLDFTGPHQVLSRLPGAQVHVASMGGQDIEAEGLVFTRLEDLTQVGRCDLICVPGGFGTTDAMLDEAFVAEIRRLASGAKYVTSVCTGSLLLAAAGLLQGRRAATHWAWRELLHPFGVTVDEGRVVRCGNVFTGGGVTAGIDLAFTIVAEIAGQEFAQALQLGLEYAPEPPFQSGRPEIAPEAVLDSVLERLGPFAKGRMAAAEQAAARLRQTA